MSQTWAEISGTTYGNPELSKKELAIAYKQMRLADAVTPSKEYAIGKKSGQSVAWRILGRISTLATTALTENQKVPFSKAPEYTATATVARYAMAIATTSVRKDMDRIDVDEANIRVLRDHLARTHNYLIWSALKVGRSFSYVPTGTASAPTRSFNATSTMPSVDAARGLQLWDFRTIATHCDIYNVPPADGETYWAFCSPSVKQAILLDTGANGYVDVAKYSSGGAEGVLNGEIGRVGQMRIVMDNDAMNQSAVSEGIGTGAAFGSMFVLGEEACKEVSVYPPHFRLNMNISNDFQNQAGVCWQSLLTYAVEKSYATHGEGSILHVASQNL
jgi:N4-gp56 family major capsid protein